MQTCCCPALHAPAGARSPDAQQGEQSDGHHGRGPQPVGEGGAGGQGLEDVKAHHTCTQQEKGEMGRRSGEAMHKSKARGAAGHRWGWACKRALLRATGQLWDRQGQQPWLSLSFGEAQGAFAGTRQGMHPARPLSTGRLHACRQARRPAAPASNSSSVVSFPHGTCGRQRRRRGTWPLLPPFQLLHWLPSL